MNTDWADRTQSEDTHQLAGRDFIYDEMVGYRYRLWFDTFSQTNPKQAQKLVDLALGMGKPKEDEKMIDLFCGVGTFSLPFAVRVKELAGIEIVETSIESAKRNAVDNDLHNTTFLARDARHGLDEMHERFGFADILLVDPPRCGAGGKVMRHIGRSQPKQIIYVSCCPDTFVTDIAELLPIRLHVSNRATCRPIPGYRACGVSGFVGIGEIKTEHPENRCLILGIFVYGKILINFNG